MKHVCTQNYIYRLITQMVDQIDVFYVSFNAWDSQASSYTPFHFSFTAPLNYKKS